MELALKDTFDILVLPLQLQMIIYRELSAQLDIIAQQEHFQK